jgi:hypothetical protein
MAKRLTTDAENATLSASRSGIRSTGQHPNAFGGDGRMKTTLREVRYARRDEFVPRKRAAKALNSCVVMVNCLKVILSIEALHACDIGA